MQSPHLDFELGKICGTQRDWTTPGRVQQGTTGNGGFHSNDHTFMILSTDSKKLEQPDTA